MDLKIREIEIEVETSKIKLEHEFKLNPKEAKYTADGDGKKYDKDNIVIGKKDVEIEDHQGGVAAVDGGEAINKGTISTDKNHEADYGMLAVGGKFKNERDKEKEWEASVVINEGRIELHGEVGMAAVNGGVAINEGTIKSEEERKNEKQFDYGMVAIRDEKDRRDRDDSEDQMTIAINKGEISNNGDFGMFASGEKAFVINGSKAKGEGPDREEHEKNLVANDGDYGMVAANGATAINFGKVANDGDYGMLAIGQAKDIEVDSFQNGGNGQNEKKFQETKAINFGTIANDGDFGMAAFAEDSNTKSPNKIYAKVEIENNGTIANLGDYGMFAAGEHVTATNEKTGIVANKGDFGMVAVDGAVAINKGLIANGEDKKHHEGDFGMLAIDAKAINEGTVANLGNFGMAAFDKGEIINKGTIANIGDFGMFASGKDTEATNEKTGVVANTGNFGMVSANGAEAVNKGTIANGIEKDKYEKTGNYGMLAVGKLDTDVDVEIRGGSQETKALNEGVIANLGDFGMAAFDTLDKDGRQQGQNSKVEIKNSGLIANTGDFGMFASGEDVKAVNGEQKNPEGPTPFSHDTYQGIVANLGDFGMVAVNGAEAINYGIVANQGDYGMLAIGKLEEERDEDDDNHGGGNNLLNGNQPTTSIVNEGVIANSGNFGMAAFHELDEKDGRGQQGKIEIVNEGNIANLGDYGMFASGKEIVLENQGMVINGNPEVAGTGNYGMVAVNGATAENYGYVGNTGDYGMLVIGKYEEKHQGGHNLLGDGNEVELLNKGTVANGGDYGLVLLREVDENHDRPKGQQLQEMELVNLGTVANGGDYGILVSGEKVSAVNGEEHHGKYGGHDKFVPTVANGGNYGMVALDEAEAINYGIVANGGDYGMAALGGSSIENEGLIANGGSYGMVASGYAKEEHKKGNDFKFEESTAVNKGTIESGEDFGMVALDGAKAENFGDIFNGGDYGMVASGVAEIKKHGHGYRYDDEEDFRSKAVNEAKGIIANGGAYGMVALDGAVALNEGLITNEGAFGMYGEGNSTVINTGALHREKDENKGHDDDNDKDWDTRLGGIYNIGDFGMVVRGTGAEILSSNHHSDRHHDGEFTLGLNMGTIANEGDYGMVAVERGAVAINLGQPEYKKPGHDDDNRDGQNNDRGEHHKHELTGNGIVSNKGDYGILALNGGIAINTGEVSNTGDVGMIAAGSGSIILNSTKSLKEILEHDDEKESHRDDKNGGLDYNEILDKLLADEMDRETDRDDRPHHAKSEAGIFNGGDYGMVAQNGALAINDGLIKNAGDVGMLINQNSLGLNLKDGRIENEGNVGVYVLGNSAFINNGTINPGNKEGVDDKFAIYAGSGNNTVYLGTDSKIDGLVYGGGGTNTLYFINGEAKEDTEEFGGGHGDHKPKDPTIVNKDNYGTIVSDSWSHIAVAGNRVTDGTSQGLDRDIDGTLTGTGDQGMTGAQYTLVVDQNITLRTSMTKSADRDYNKNANGVITYDKFNSLEAEDVELSTDYVNDGNYTGDIVIEDGNSIIMRIAQNRTSVLAANSLDLQGDSKIVQQAYDQVFVTQANRIEIKNILLNDVADIEEALAKIVVENLADGWEYTIVKDVDANGVETGVVL